MKAVAIFRCDSQISCASMRLRAIVTTTNAYKKVIKQMILDEEICTERTNSELSVKERVKEFESKWIEYGCWRKSVYEISDLTQSITTECYSKEIDLNKVDYGF